MDAVRYTSHPEELLAVEVTRDSAEAAAMWCGGEAVNGGDVESGMPVVYVPSVAGPIPAFSGQFIVRNEKSGRFTVLDRATLGSRYARRGPSFVIGNENAQAIQAGVESAKDIRDKYRR